MRFLGCRSLPALLALVFLLPATSPSADAKKTAAQETTADKLIASADEIGKQVAKLRGLALKKKIRRGVMSKAQIKAHILKLLHKEYSDAELDAEALAMKRFGLIPESSDYVKIMVGLLEDQIAGFYDSSEKKLYIAGWAPMGGDMLMAHEIDHALQDQHFDLEKFMTPNKRNGDAMVARQALVEGDGMALMLEFQMAAMKQAPPWGNPFVLKMLKQSMSKSMGGMGHVPLAMRESLVFPYVGGLEFIAHFRKHHPWTTIDAIYKKPPLSTEQILHPAKYESYEKPVVVSAKRPASLAGYSETVTSVQGEKGIELFLRSHGVEHSRAIRAAAGWGGDRMAVYAAQGHRGSMLANTVGVSLSSWDDEAEAQEFFEALEHALPQLAGKSPRRKADGALQPAFGKGGLQFAIGKDGVALAERRGERVLILIDAPSASAEQLRAELWKTWSVAH